MPTPLVSIVVASYNASKTIVETLDSIKNQTYSPLELIIADDCSQDDTAIKCEEWLAENQNRFVRSKLIVNEENKGISANFNIGVRASSGEWIKIFGDDILLPDAIEKNVCFAIKNECNMVFSRVIYFSEETKEELKILPEDDYFFPVSSHEQFLTHIRNRFITPTPTWFYKRELFDKLGGYDEHYRLLEDYPFQFKMLELGERFSYLPQVTVRYRITNTSVSNSKKSTGKKKQPFFEDRLAVFYELRVPALKKHGFWGSLIYYKMVYFFYRKKIYSKDNSIARYFYGALCCVLSFFRKY
ncbi:MAG: glycosyltransferase [Bacteroidales bacterium]|nr:glycosyltransferase [Bacteroidales bacterium]